MKTMIRKLSLFLILTLLAGLFSAVCLPANRIDAQAARKVIVGGKSGGSEDGKNDGNPPAAVQTETDEEIRDLTKSELRKLNKAVDVRKMGFATCSYARPEEIKWAEVLYDGAGIDCEAPQALKDELIRQHGDIMGDITAIRNEDIARFVRETTGTDYDDARYPLDGRWRYYADDDLYYHVHGDTNYFPISFTSGTVQGDVYRLKYMGTDWQHYRFDREFILTVRIRDDQWTFLSNLPADDVPPLQLMTIDFYSTSEQALKAGASELTASLPDYGSLKDPELMKLLERNCFWAVLTAEENGVRYVIDKMDLSDPSLVYEIDTNDLFVPGENITAGVLDKGEKIAVYVPMVYPGLVKLAAFKDSYYASYLFGNDESEYEWPYTWKDGIPKSRYLLAHDMNGEGRGDEWKSETDLYNFLEGRWLWIDPATGLPAATVRFYDYRAMEVQPFDSDGAYKFYLDYKYVYADPDSGVPDLLCTEAYDDQTKQLMEKTGLSTCLNPESTGDYLVSAVQLDGEQILFLDQANNGDGFLNYLLGGAHDGYHASFEFIRFRGSMEEEEQYPGDGFSDEIIQDAFSVLSDYEEIQYKLETGLSARYYGIEEIGGKDALVFDFGTDHKENYVHEAFYAISLDLETAYFQDYMTGEWEILGRG